MVERGTILSTERTQPFYNLAVEETLLYRVRPGEVILFLWQNKKTVVVGRNQNAWAECRVQRLEADGGQLARRLSGGGAVFHDLGNLNFTFLAREGDYDVEKQVAVIRSAVRKFGLIAERTGRNDLAIDGAKFSGNAYYRSGVYRYHHGTLLLHADMDQMAQYLTPSRKKLESKGVSSVQSRVVNLQDLAPGITVSTMKRALSQAFGQVYGLLPTQLKEESLDAEELARREKKFADQVWRYLPVSEFTWTSKEYALPFGLARLCLAQERGRVSRAVLFTDALEEGIARSVSQALVGQRICRSDLEKALDRAEREDCIPLVEGIPEEEILV